MRASRSKLMDTAYEQYTILWQRHPNDPYANLLRGMAAEYLGIDILDPHLHKFYSRVPVAPLFPIAADCLAKAAEMAPNSATMNREYGFFLWQFGGKMAEGLKLLKKALQLAPNEPRIHTMWGNVYANPYGTDYNLQRATHELELSIRMDPTYGFTHSLLANVYRRLGQAEKAEREERTYENLLP